MKKFLALIALVSVLSADSFELGMQAYEDEAYAKAYKLWEPLALEGHVEAQRNLAMLLEDGDGITQDAQKAIYWYEKAAAQGDINAQLVLAMSYCYGDGVTKDLKSCANWAYKAKEQGENVAILVQEFDLQVYR